jgi:hypothetical protein
MDADMVVGHVHEALMDGLAFDASKVINDLLSKNDQKRT